jgi:Type I phosphodiesterase / nucleotide pyrophosphatase
VLNAVLPPLVASLRVPWTLPIGFVLVLFIDAGALLVADRALPDFIAVDSFGDALVAAIAVAAISVALETALGTNDDDRYTLRVIERVARRGGNQARTDVPGIVFLEIDGLALPVLQHAMAGGSAPTMARWLADDGYRLLEWETDLSSQTGASQAGILLGSNEDIPAFRWVDKETATLRTCSSPADCAAIERRLANGGGLLANGGASRGNLLSGEAEEAILTVSRMEAEKRANPGYRAFLANGFNVTRALALFAWEVGLEWIAAARQTRRDVRPRGHRGGRYPFLRAAMCVVIRDLVVFGVLGDMMRGRPAVYATFASYDEVAHHSGLERADTMEALRKLDQQFGRIARARRYAPRPYEIVVLSDHGQTQGATFKQRNGYGLDELVERSLHAGDVEEVAGGDEQEAMVAHSINEATGRKATRRPKTDVSRRRTVVLGSGNLGLIYLMEERRRLTLEELDERHPELIPALRAHPHIGWLLVRSSERGPVVLGADGTRYLREDRVEGDDPLAVLSPTAGSHLRRTDRFANVADIMVGSFYDPLLEEGCAFEELISFHGGLGGPQTRPFILYPAALPAPSQPLSGAASIHELLAGWRRGLQYMG